jgi:hypothetical protein
MAVSMYTPMAKSELGDLANTYQGLPFNEIMNVGLYKDKNQREALASASGSLSAIAQYNTAPGSQDEQWYYNEYLPKVQAIGQKYASKELSDPLIYNSFQQEMSSLKNPANMIRIKNMMATAKNAEEYTAARNKLIEEGTLLADESPAQPWVGANSSKMPWQGAPTKALDYNKKLDEYYKDIEKTNLGDIEGFPGMYRYGIGDKKISDLANKNADDFLNTNEGQQAVRSYMRKNKIEDNDQNRSAIAKQIIKDYGERHKGYKIEGTFLGDKLARMQGQGGQGFQSFWAQMITDMNDKYIQTNGKEAKTYQDPETLGEVLGVPDKLGRTIISTDHIVASPVLIGDNAKEVNNKYKIVSQYKTIQSELDRVLSENKDKNNPFRTEATASDILNKPKFNPNLPLDYNSVPKEYKSSVARLGIKTQGQYVKHLTDLENNLIRGNKKIIDLTNGSDVANAENEYTDLTKLGQALEGLPTQSLTFRPSNDRSGNVMRAEASTDGGMDYELFVKGNYELTNDQFNKLPRGKRKELERIIQRVGGNLNTQVQDHTGKMVDGVLIPHYAKMGGSNNASDIYNFESAENRKLKGGSLDTETLDQIKYATMYGQETYAMSAINTQYLKLLKKRSSIAKGKEQATVEDVQFINNQINQIEQSAQERGIDLSSVKEKANE